MKHRTGILSTALALPVVLGLVACASTQPPPAAPSNADVTPPPSMANAASANAASANAANAANVAASAPSDVQKTPLVPSVSAPYGAANTMGDTLLDASKFDDSQIAAVVGAINQGEIQEGQLAAANGKSADVKRFAQHMVTAHRAFVTHDTAVLAKAQITPTDSVVSSQLQNEANSQIATLQSAQPADFDRQYVDNQVQGHKQALEFLDRVTPNVKNPDLKTDLLTTRPKVEAHLRMAKQLQQQIEAGAPGTTSSP